MLTAQEVYDEILEICAESPDLINPTDNGACLYFKDDPWPGEATNCLIGRFFVRHGVDVSNWPIRSITFGWKEFVPPEYHHLVDLLGQVQMIADRRILWGEVAQWCKINSQIHLTIGAIDGNNKETTNA